MSAFLDIVKQLLNIKSSDETEDEALARDIEDYERIVTSTKYADSNADTTALTALFQSLGVKTDIESQLKTGGSTVEAEDKPGEDSKVNGQETKEGDERNFHFRQRLSNHLDLLKELEAEEGRILPGQPVYQPAKFGKDGGANFSLQQFKVPRAIYDAMAFNDINRLDIHSPLTPSNYIWRFQTLLWVEEAHQAVEMRRYDMSSVMLGKYENFFSVQVPGLAEGRPSLMRGDKLMLRNPRRSAVYEGYIHDVRERDVLIKLHEHLHASTMDGLRFDVSFISSRTAFRRCHHGVVQFKGTREDPSNQKKLKAIAFPVAETTYRPPLIDVIESDASQLRCFRQCLNTYQRNAIINALRAECRPAPYIIFGPPGTGKTLTMVEVVLQAYARKKAAKILVCGNSNACVDLLAHHLKDSGVIPLEHMIRVAAFYRMDKDLIPENIQDIAMDMDMIDSKTYADARVIITTCIQSGCLYEFHDRFDYVFIDEAGHASEPEAMLSISLLKENGCCVLAGDPHQLGPVCMSNVAFEKGLGSSLLERLSRRAVYNRQVIDGKMAYDSRYITQLLVCYRCDSRVLSIGNEMFYNNALKFVNQTPEFWMKTLKVKHPLVFHPVKGKDRRDYANPSWFNPNEAFTCLGYVNKLYYAGLKPEQLGIITPYKRQIQKMELLFESCNLKKCKIATMEEFQGDEREIIIISTVRSRQKNMEFDKRFRLGFLFNPKRFNVAISRAKWMVIAVGDPDILALDDYWPKYIDRAFKIEAPQQDERTK